MQTKLVDRICSIKPAELAILAYLLYTTLLIVFYHHQIAGPLHLIVIRILLTIALFIVSQVDQNKTVAFVRLFLPFTFLGYLYGETHLFNTIFLGDFLDHFFARLDQYIFGFQPSLRFSAFFNQQLIAEIMSIGYFLFYPLIIILPFLLFIKQKRNLADYSSFIILNSFIVFFILFIFIPVAGPQYFFNAEKLPVINGGAFTKLIRIVQEVGERPTGAFPSSHVGVTLIVLQLSWKYIRNLFYLLLPVAFVLILSTVYISAHYAVDIIGAFIFAPFIYAFSNYSYHKIMLRPIYKLQLWLSQFGK